jgi:predicted helicase
VEIFLACNVEEILKNYGKSTKMEDPIIHFYETFLSEYDPKLRKARGVWYTPAPVVNFIVRAVDDILKTEFDLPQGLADSSKTKIKVDVQGKQMEQEVHKVQILDPATGTGTFLAEVVKHIHKKFEGQQGIWSNYVETHLLPRLNGFELLMASYAMAHLKLDLLLTQTGYKPTTNQRFRVYLTNSLEEHHQDTGTLFANWLSTEANEANHIKRDTPVMCVIGNPPYSGISSNNGEWISKLIEDYKYVDGVHFNERKHWLNDDYVKFLRYGQHFIEKNGSGVLAFINPHGFLDNPTFRGMRWHLLKTYDKIYTIDLHGNSKKKETAPDGSADINVFDIQQGVSINIFVKTGKKKANELGKVFHFDLYGKREMKYDFLSEKNLNDIDFTELKYNKPYYFFVPKNDDGKNDFENGFKINEIFSLNNTGIVTGIDRLSIFLSKVDLETTLLEILTSENPYDKFKIEDTRRTTKEGRIKELREAYQKGVVKFNYRPFDTRYTLPFTLNEHWINSPRTDVMQHFLKGENIGLICPKQVPDKENSGAFITKYISGHKTSSAYNINNIFPLYLYPETKGQQTIGQTAERTPNLNTEIVKQIEDKLGLTFTNEKETTKDTFAPIDILDYIYAVLHSPTYREKYKEFLKIDFPRVPYPKDKDIFWQLVKLGGAIRQIHLLESPTVEKYITQYPIDGNNVVGKTKYQDRKVYINDTQYFDNVPQVAWEFYIGGYQPAQKWLKDRKERKLEFDDILHYQKIIVALTETDRLMNEINKINIE